MLKQEIPPKLAAGIYKQKKSHHRNPTVGQASLTSKIFFKKWYKKLLAKLCLKKKLLIHVPKQMIYVLKKRSYLVGVYIKWNPN